MPDAAHENPPAGAGATLTVLVADADAGTRGRLCASLEEEGLHVVRAVGDADAAIAAATRLRPSLCLLALELESGGLRAVAAIAGAVATTIVVLAAAEDPGQMLAALALGAAGYLRRDIGGAELARALRAAADGEPAVPRSLVPHLIEQIRGAPRRRLELPGGAVTLTPRESEVAELLRRGRRTQEIAVALGVSPVTVRRHAALLARKLGAPSRHVLIDILRAFGG